jgi:hypothetical protein
MQRVRPQRLVDGPERLAPDPDTGTAEEGVGTFRIEANLGLLMKLTALAVDVTWRGWQLHNQRCLPQ